MKVNEQARKDYRKMTKQLNYIQKRSLRQILDEIENDIFRRLDTEYLNEDDCFESHGVLTFTDKDFHIKVIGWICCNCDERHIEIVEVSEVKSIATDFKIVYN